MSIYTPYYTPIYPAKRLHLFKRDTIWGLGRRKPFDEVVAPFDLDFRVIAL